MMLTCQCHAQVGNRLAHFYNTSYAFPKLYNCVDSFAVTADVNQHGYKNFKNMNCTFKYKPKSI